MFTVYSVMKESNLKCCSLNLWFLHWFSPVSLQIVVVTCCCCCCCCCCPSWRVFLSFNNSNVNGQQYRRRLCILCKKGFVTKIIWLRGNSEEEKRLYKRRQKLTFINILFFFVSVLLKFVGIRSIGKYCWGFISEKKFFFYCISKWVD